MSIHAQWTDITAAVDLAHFTNTDINTEFAGTNLPVFSYNFANDNTTNVFSVKK